MNAEQIWGLGLDVLGLVVCVAGAAMFILGIIGHRKGRTGATIILVVGSVLVWVLGYGIRQVANAVWIVGMMNA